jgi:amidase
MYRPGPGAILDPMRRLTAIEISTEVRAGRRTPQDVLEESLASIGALDPNLGAFQVVAVEAARAEAVALSARADLATLPLAGVPVAIKDNIDVAGLPTRHGSAATSTEPAANDDELVRRLRAAGVIVVGKTRMPELAIWSFTESSALGGTRNPLDPTRNAGGSTGGGAAAVSSGMVPLALGTDGGGSLRIPAANCGVVGLKPARGTLPLPGGAPSHWYGCSVAGPITATTADAALALAILAGVPNSGPLDGPLRIAVSRRPPMPFAQPDRLARAGLGRAEELLRAAGHNVTRGDPPYPPTLIQQWIRHWLAGVAEEVEALGLPIAQLEPRTRTVVTKGNRLRRRGRPREDEAQQWRDRALSWFQDVDVLLSPVVARQAPAAGWADGRGYLPSYLDAARSITYTQAWNLAGLAAVSVPIGRDGNRALSAQLVAPTEAAVLQAAAALEGAAGG